MPSKNDDSTPASAESNTGDTPKKTPRRRSTTSTPRAPRTKSRKAAASSEAVAELPFAPEPPAPAPVAPPPPQPEPRDSGPNDNGSRSPDEPRRHQERADERPAAESSPSVEQQQPSSDHGAGNDNGAPVDQQSQGGQGQGASGGQAGGDWQDRGGGGGRDREFWKRNKRKRGRHGGGGHWQPGGGGGQPREQHPPQPPPPSNTPVFGELPNPTRFNDLAALETQAQEISSGGGDPIYLHELYALNLADLTAFARGAGVSFEGAPNRKQLITQVLATAAEKKRPLKDRGYIDVTDRGAFVVHEHVNYRLYPEDPYLPESLIKLFGLKRGHRLEVLVQAPLPGERCPSVLRIESVMSMPPAEISKIIPFEELVPYYPLKRILLESEEPQKDVSMRAVDILTPIGFGQRALIVAPPRTGKTVLLQNIANSVTENSPDAKLILLLIDERPEEVTDFKRSVPAEIWASSNDEQIENHLRIADLCIERAKRLVEVGRDVVLFLDSITRLARAHNTARNSGRTGSGGLDVRALEKPRQLFASARKTEEAGSLTIIASVLVETGSRMDDVIFQEFKGTGNMELVLDRKCAEMRLWPAMNVASSGTRKEELLIDAKTLEGIHFFRRALVQQKIEEATETMIARLSKTKTNAEFLKLIQR